MMRRALALSAAVCFAAHPAFAQVPGGAPMSPVQQSAPTSYVLSESAVAVPVTGTASETTLGTCTVPANAMGPNGHVRVTALWTYTNNADAKTLRIKFGGTIYYSGAVTTNAQLKTQIEVANRGATNSQVGAALGISGFGSAAGAVVTSAVDTTASTTVAITGQLGTTTDTIQLESYTCEVLLNPGG